MLLPYVERGHGRRLAFAHGFTQTKNSWNQIIDLLGPEFHSLSFDAPGHGDAAMLPFNCSEAAEAINNVAGDATYIGYSMGARIMLHAAVQFPEEVTSLVMVSGSPGLRSETERGARVESDAKLADQIKELGVAKFVDAWLDGPLFAGLNDSNDQKEDRLGNTADGLIRSLKLCGTGAQESLWPALSSLNMPILLIVGELDSKFCDIGEQMKSMIGSNAQLEVVPGVGHSVHMEAPEIVSELLRNFLATV